MTLPTSYFTSSNSYVQYVNIMNVYLLTLTLHVSYSFEANETWCNLSFLFYIILLYSFSIDLNDDDNLRISLHLTFIENAIYNALKICRTNEFDVSNINLSIRNHTVVIIRFIFIRTNDIAEYFTKYQFFCKKFWRSDGFIVFLDSRYQLSLLLTDAYRYRVCN